MCAAGRRRLRQNAQTPEDVPRLLQGGLRVAAPQGDVLGRELLQGREVELVDPVACDEAAQQILDHARKGEEPFVVFVVHGTKASKEHAVGPGAVSALGALRACPRYGGGLAVGVTALRGGLKRTGASSRRVCMAARRCSQPVHRSSPRGRPSAVHDTSASRPSLISPLSTTGRAEENASADDFGSAVRRGGAAVRRRGPRVGGSSRSSAGRSRRRGRVGRGPARRRFRR